MLVPSTLCAGDRVPNFMLPAVDGKLWVFYEKVVGRPNLLVVLPGLDGAAAAAAGRWAVADGSAGGRRFDRFLVVGAAAPAVRAALGSDAPAATVFCDPKRETAAGLAKAFGLAGAPGFAVATDPNQRVVEIAPLDGDPDAVLSRLADTLARRFAPSDAPVHAAVAPVLIIPDVLDANHCRLLIERWHEAGHEEGMVQQRDAGGRDVKTIDRAAKSRLDHQVTDRAFAEALGQLVGRRIGPELTKTTYRQGFAFDRFVITCYRGDRRDHFSVHRDNTTGGTQHRMYALTLNLNEGYEGGELIFPEYGEARYKPAAGGAILFSCSLLHRVTPVVAGERFTLLNFLSDPQAAQRQRTALGNWAR